MTRRVILFGWLGAALSGLAQTEAETQWVPMEDRWYDTYFNSPPPTLLHDPQRLLRGAEARKAREFLDYYSEDSLINLRVLLFKGDQLLVRSSTATALHNDWPRAAKPEVVVYYYMGAPERAEMHLSAELRAAVPEIETERALASCIEWANSGVTPVEALNKFMVQLSIRAGRMERLLIEGTASPAPLVAEPVVEVDAESSTLTEMLAQMLAFWQRHQIKLIGALLTIVLLVWWRWMRHKRASYEFPDHDCEPRLGAAHACGVGGVMSFSKSSPPPAAQREKMFEH